MIIDAASARERVRLILDRANSPWLTDSEINGFIEMSINEYIRERVGMFGGNQKLRDDFGAFVKHVAYSNVLTNEDEEPGAGVLRRQFGQYDDAGIPVPNIVLPLIYPGGESANAGLGVICPIKDADDENDENTDAINFGFLVEIKLFGLGGQGVGGGTRVKVLSLDKALSIKSDPFHKADSNAGEYHAVRVGDNYIIRPVNVDKWVIITYVSNNNDVENIHWLPIHGREEVCQIAARKIMGTVADERYPTGDTEIKQLEGK